MAASVIQVTESDSFVHDGCLKSNAIARSDFASTLKCTLILIFVLINTFSYLIFP